MRLLPSFLALFFLTGLNFTLAQSHNILGLKTYSGHLLSFEGNPGSFWQTVTGKTRGKDLYDRTCAVIFKSPVSFTDPLVAEVPKELAYSVNFKAGGFDKFVIKIYTQDGQDFLIDPHAEGVPPDANGEYRLTDPYLIYLVLGHEITRLEVVPTTGDSRDKYILDKMEVGSN